MTSAAEAADVIYDAPVAVAPIVSAYDWSGFYVGIYGGYGSGDLTAESEGGVFHSLNDFADPLDDAKGGFYGGTLGYNYQIDNWVLGLEADFAGSDFDADFVSSDPEWHADLDWLLTVRPRVGYAFDKFLPYVTGGLAVGRVGIDTFDRVADDDGGSDSRTMTGYTVGAGVEYAVFDNLTLKAEYNYVDLGSREFDLTGGPADFFGVEDVDVDFHLGKIGLNYRF
ncbi:porin family protein [Jiella sp. KSK16Y-1]|uniref:Porin family protein n=1 Tax=Jiella mangrovi TaxID=2821407 RepID=A0ABS4BHB5_9HYPH|nr:porin family protein [Jiella mangrovi]